jgi:subtilisin family serine protease
MKTTLLLVIMFGLLTVLPARAQQVLFKNLPKDSVVRSSSRMVYEYVPGEMIVKFKDNAQVKSTGAKLKSASAVTDALQAKYNVQKTEPLFPGENRLKSAQMLTAPNGKQFLQPSLHNIFKLKIADEKQLMNAISDFKADTANMVYAEPNYIISICNDKPVGPILTEADVKMMQSSKAPTETQAVVDDPMYDQQWYIPAVKADLVWPQTKGDTTQIIAILDTGVDWLHPDLKNKIWKNPNPSTNSYPDGIVNDIRGWDFINNDNDPMDDNSHGTHVAGIAAAETNNGIGIAGVCPLAKIMPVKVFQSTGKGDVATIAKGIKYAASHGATVINMSFGSYARSLAMEDALSNAYATCVLVASAGNDNLPIGPGAAVNCSEKNLGAPSYPAALSYVLGVQSPEACFSNYDQDGPTFSAYSDLLNYEMKAPGTNVLSTVPNGGYRVYQGTSMAAPIVAGLVALYKKQKPTDSQELLYGNLINSIGTYIDIQKALSIVPTPQLAVVTYSIADTLDGDRDGRPDVGETIELKVSVRNTWGQANDVKVGIAFKEFEDTTTASILTSEAVVGSISPYATRFNVTPLKLKLANNIADGRDINFVLKTWYGDHQGETSQTITINIENGVELKGIISSNMTLYPNKQYIVTDNLAIAEGATLTIKPGTILKLSENKSMVVAGNVIAIGKPDSLIVFTKRNSFNSWGGLHLGTSGFIRMNYCNLDYGGGLMGILFTSDYGNNRCSSFNNIYFNYNFGGIYCQNSLSISKCVFTNNMFGVYVQNNDSITYSNLIGNSSKINNLPTGLSSSDKNPFIKNNCIFNNFSAEKELNYWSGVMGFSIIKLLPNYFGTNNSNKINKTIYDFEEDASKPLYDISSNLNIPPKENHGIVWKVVVNGKDAQDEFDKLDPLGVGKQKFEVYFNRPMDIQYPPSVSMGVSAPYTQTAIAESGTWSADSTIYTAYRNVGLTTGDGINIIRVAGAKDNDHFEIPIEDRRFRVVVSAASSSSLTFQATPGLGKVSLEWNNAGLKDLMGFNMYRMENINDSTLTKPALVNKTLISDTTFVDFTGKPNKKYYYFYKVVRTDMTESDSSKVVSATPFTAAKGDANGDLKVDVLDITSIVAYLLGQNPTPFIFDAADVNADKAVNVLDVVGVANIIKGGKSAVVDETNKYNPSIAYITLKPEIIQLKSDAQVQAVQFELQGSNLDKVQLSTLLKGFELAYSVNGGKITGVLYNLTGLTIPAGITDVIAIEAGAGKLTWGSVFGADPQGRYVTIMKKEDASLTTPTSPFGLSVQPNPSGSDMQISFRLPETAKVTMKVYNVMGTLVSQLMDNTLSAGSHQMFWKGSNGNGETVKPGVYFIRVESRDTKNQTLKEQAKVVRL